MSKSLSTKMYLKQRLYELNICDVSDLLQHIKTFDLVIGNLVLVNVKIDLDDDNATILLCSLSPLLTTLLCNKLPINLEKVGYGNEDGNDERWLEVISWEPKAFVYHNFLTNEECDHLISLVKPRMVKSKVVDKINGGSKESSARTSSGAFLNRGHDEIVKEIENKISEFTFIPVENGEGLQVIRYEAGQKFAPHYDGLQRIATVLMYLSDVDKGGETVFPNAKGNIDIKKLSVSPKKRDALLFWNMRPDGSPDLSSLHGGSPVIKGNKWASTKWFHANKR